MANVTIDEKDYRKGREAIKILQVLENEVQESWIGWDNSVRVGRKIARIDNLIRLTALEIEKNWSEASVSAAFNGTTLEVLEHSLSAFAAKMKDLDN